MNESTFVLSGFGFLNRETWICNITEESHLNSQNVTEIVNHLSLPKFTSQNTVVCDNALILFTLPAASHNSFETLPSLHSSIIFCSWTFPLSIVINHQTDSSKDPFVLSNRLRTRAQAGSDQIDSTSNRGQPVQRLRMIPARPTGQYTASSVLRLESHPTNPHTKSI